MYIYRGKLNFKSEDNAVSADNEGITLMFPSEFHLGYPAYVCWQWSEKDGSTKVKAFYTTTIDELITTSTFTRVGFNYDGDYVFDATFSGNIDKLSFIMRGKSGGTSDQTDLLLVYKPDSGVPQDPSVPRIYTGKLAYSTYAVDELLVVIAPGSMDEGKTICAFWQWTQTPENDEKQNAEEKQNVDDVTTISDVKPVEEDDDAGESLRFYYGDKSYTFDVEILEVSEALKLTMKDTKGVSTGELTFHLEDLDLPSSHGPRELLGRTKRAVYNDTSEIVTCSISDSSTIIADRFLAVAGLILGFAGFATLPASVSLSVGILVASASMTAAVGGAVQAFAPSGDAASAVLFPGDTMERTSSWRLFSNNDIHVHLVRIDNAGDKPRLVISTATVEKVGDKTQNLSELIPEQGLAPTYKELLAIMLPSQMRLLAYRTIAIEGLTINRTVKDIKDMKDNDIPNALMTSDKPTSIVNWYGTLDDYYKSVKDTDPDDQKLFEYSSSVSLVFSQSAGDGASHAKLDNCYVSNVSQRPLGIRKDEEEVKKKIANNRGYWSYTWSASKRLFANRQYEGSPGPPAIYYSEDSNRCVLFVVEKFNPILSLVAK